MKKLNKILVVVFLIAAALIIYTFAKSNRNTENFAGQPQTETASWIIEAQNSEKAEKITSGEYVIDIEKSTINWEGSKPLVLNYKNRGTLDVKEGYFSVNGGVLSSGQIMLDMNSINVTEATTSGAAASIERHLKSADFFDVENYSEALINFVGAEPIIAEGVNWGSDLTIDLTMKGNTQQLVVPTRVYEQGGFIFINGQAELDRTLWDIRFGSDKFFDNLADNVISDNFLVEFQFVAPVDEQE